MTRIELSEVQIMNPEEIVDNRADGEKYKA